MLEELIKTQMQVSKGNQMTEEEYRYIASFLGDKNFLVFGTGYDSNIWRFANKGGVTLFLEHNTEWIKDEKDILKVKYSTKRIQYKQLLEEYKRGQFNNLVMDLPDSVNNINWDYIFVDSPEGYSDDTHGRMQSIYMASILSSEITEVFVHDCHRVVEDIYTNEMFSKCIKQLTTLRHLKK